MLCNRLTELMQLQTKNLYPLTNIAPLSHPIPHNHRSTVSMSLMFLDCTHKWDHTGLIRTWPGLWFLNPFWKMQDYKLQNKLGVLISVLTLKNSTLRGHHCVTDHSSECWYQADWFVCTEHLKQWVAHDNLSKNASRCFTKNEWGN